MEDYITAVSARLSPIKGLGADLLSAAIRVYMTLWPGSETPVSTVELSRCLLATEKRLEEWQESAARAGADEALTFVLSWYEEINLDDLKAMRSDSKWMTDP